MDDQTPGVQPPVTPDPGANPMPAPEEPQTPPEPAQQPPVDPGVGPAPEAAPVAPEQPATEGDASNTPSENDGTPTDVPPAGNPL